jgi:hypothetical protein
MQATELFDIVDELTPRGGARTIYRINPRFQLEISPDPVAAGERGAGQPAKG